MKKRTIWLVVSGLMVVSLVLASCAPKAAEEKKVVTEEKKAVAEEKKVVTEEKKVVTQEQKVVAEEPRYGGVLNLAASADPARGFSRTVMFARPATSPNLITNETLLTVNSLKGPRGSNEWSGMYSVVPPPEIFTGLLAESWEIVEPDTLKFKIRKGVHWQDKAPANGAEMTAEDVVYSFVLKYAIPGNEMTTGFPYISDLKNPENSIYLDPDDPWTVVTKTKPGMLADWYQTLPTQMFVVPKALGDPKGTGPDTWTWKTAVGTGPFYLTDYVTGSSLTFERNPNYWRKDPFRPQNQLPYLDSLKQVIIADLSTQRAALRTGKIDILAGVEAEEAESLFRSNPELRSASYLADFYQMAMKHTVKPWNDVRVRRAMTMAINYKEMVNDYYGGKAEMFWWPAWPVAEHKLMYTPLEQMPKEVQELFGFHPDKAKQLLAEAGYPNGFNTSIVVSSVNEEVIDLMSVVKAYWAKVGVDLKIDVKEPAVFAAMGRAHSYEQGYWSTNFITAPTKFTSERVGRETNHAEVNDPLLEKTMEDTTAVFFDWAKVSAIIKERAPQLIMNVPHIRMPIPHAYVIWQPWVKDYNGEARPQHKKTELSAGDWVWIDQDLKQKMTGRR